MKKYRIDYEEKSEFGESPTYSVIYQYDDDNTTIVDALDDFFSKHPEETLESYTIIMEGMI